MHRPRHRRWARAVIVTIKTWRSKLSFPTSRRSHPDQPTPSDLLLAATPTPDVLGDSRGGGVSRTVAGGDDASGAGQFTDPARSGRDRLACAGWISTKNDPSIIESDPRFGIEGALSAFDAHVHLQFLVEKNDRALNNVFFGGGTRILKQDFATWQTQVSKTAATGTQYAFKNYTQYDANNAPGNIPASAVRSRPGTTLRPGTRCCRAAAPASIDWRDRTPSPARSTAW